MNLTEIKEKVLPILESAHVKRALVFGSVARGEENPGDVDLLVEMPRPYGLFTFLSVKNNLEDALRMKVDLIEYSLLKPGIRERALRDAVVLI